MATSVRGAPASSTVPRECHERSQPIALILFDVLIKGLLVANSVKSAPCNDHRLGISTHFVPVYKRGNASSSLLCFLSDVVRVKVK